MARSPSETQLQLSPLQPPTPLPSWCRGEQRPWTNRTTARPSTSQGGSAQPCHVLSAPPPRLILELLLRSLRADDNKNNRLVADLTTFNSHLARPEVSKGLTTGNGKGKKAAHLIWNKNLPGPTYWPRSEVFKKGQSPPNTRTSYTRAPPRN